MDANVQRAFSRQKQRVLSAADRRAEFREDWIARNWFFFQDDWRYFRFLVPRNKRVLDLGCGTGALLNVLQPRLGVGIDFSGEMIAVANRHYPHLRFVHGDVERLDQLDEIDGPFDIIIMSDTVGCLTDCLKTFSSLHRYCVPQTRIIVSYHSPLWQPFIAAYSWIRTGMRPAPSNWLSSQDIANLLELADFEVVKREWRILCPFHLLGVGTLINRFIATLPLIRKLALRTYVVARPRPQHPLGELSASVVIPCRNERGNIEAAVTRLPRFTSDLEVIFVEGHSSDGTWEEIQRVKAAYRDIDIKAFKQPGQGKGDAVRKGLDEARGEVLMILDADLTTPPEELPKFYDALIAGKGEFINGSRLVYPMERQAMRFLNLVANLMFAALFTYLLNQRYTDTLCGTKVIRRGDYREIVATRDYFGNFDPFGDFDLIFGASKLNLKTAEMPIRYAARDYGVTQISRFRHGWLLLRMVIFAFKKLKAL